MVEFTTYTSDDKFSSSANRSKRLNISKELYKNPHLRLYYDKNDETVVLGYYTREFKEYSPQEIKWIQISTGYHFNNCFKGMMDVTWNRLQKQGMIKPHFIQVSQFNQLPTKRKEFYTSYHKKYISLENDITFIKHSRTVELNLLKLKDKQGSRYGAAFKAIIELHDEEVLTYTGKGRTKKNIRDALRQGFIKKFYASNYEWNCWYIGEVGLSIFQDLERHSIKYLSWSTTLYFTDYRDSELLYILKYYNKTAQLEGRDYNLNTDHYKFEITFQKNFFYQNKLRDVRLYKTQFQIQQLLTKYITRHLRKYSVNLLSSRSKRLLKTSLNIKLNNQIIPTILSEERTINHISSLL